MIRAASILFMVGMSFSGVVAQNFLQTVKCANAFYNGASSLQLGMEYRMYENAEETIPKQITKGEYLRSGARSYSDINGLISVVTEKASVTVDKQNKTLMVDATSSAIFNPWGKIDQATLEKVFSKTELVETEKGLLHYRLIPLKGIKNDVSRMDVWFNAEKCYVKRIIMYFNEIELPAYAGATAVKQRPKVEVIYTEINWNENPDPKIFTTRPYLRWENGTPAPTSAFQDYAFINAYKP